jgi:hypothetical protein
VKRFRVAFSFAGEKRDFVARTARILAERFGEDTILYDKFHESEFARRDLGIYLPELYHNQSDLVIVVVCPAYDAKQWTGLEWGAIYDLLSQRKDDDVLLCRFNLATVPGLYSTAGFIELDHKTPEQFARLILERLALNEGKPKDYYTKGVNAGEPSSAASMQGTANYVAPSDSIGKKSVKRWLLAVAAIITIATVLVLDFLWQPALRLSPTIRQGAVQSPVQSAMPLSQRISGIVTDESDSPVEGAKVVMIGSSTSTTSGQDGSFSLEVHDADELAHLSITKDGFHPLSEYYPVRRDVRVVLRRQ